MPALVICRKAHNYIQTHVPSKPIRKARRAGAVVGLSVLLLSLWSGSVAASPPTVQFDEPINDSATYNASTEVTISDGTLVLTGSATDPDGISHLTIAREFEYHDGEDDGRGTEVDRYYATPSASNGTFEHRVPLGTGTNELNISVVDGAGVPSKLDVVVHVDDEEAPTAERLDASADGEWVHIEGWIRDNVQVAEVRAASQTLQTQTGTRDLDREDVRLDHRVPHPDGETVTVTLVDQAGNSREVVLPIGGERTATATATATPTATPTEMPTSTATATTTANATTTSTAAATPPVRTPTPGASGGGTGPLGLLGVVIVVGAALAMLSVGGGGF